MRPFSTLKFWLFQIDTSLRFGFLLLAFKVTSFLYFLKIQEASCIAWFLSALGKLAGTSLLVYFKFSITPTKSSTIEFTNLIYSFIVDLINTSCAFVGSNFTLAVVCKY